MPKSSHPNAGGAAEIRMPVYMPIDKKTRTVTLRQPQHYLATAPELESLKTIAKIETRRAGMAEAQNAVARNKNEVKAKREKRLKDKKKRKKVVQVDDSSSKEDSSEEE